MKGKVGQITNSEGGGSPIQHRLHLGGSTPLLSDREVVTLTRVLNDLKLAASIRYQQVLDIWCEEPVILSLSSSVHRQCRRYQETMSMDPRDGYTVCSIRTLSMH